MIQCNCIPPGAEAGGCTEGIEGSTFNWNGSSPLAATDSLKMISPTTVCTHCAISRAIGLSSSGGGILAMAALATIVTRVNFRSGLVLLLLSAAVLAASSVYSLRLLEMACWSFPGFLCFYKLEYSGNGHLCFGIVAVQSGFVGAERLLSAEGHHARIGKTRLQPVPKWWKRETRWNTINAAWLVPGPCLKEARKGF